MSALPAEPKRKLTEAEYLEIEDKAEFKSEFFNGEMFPVGGAPYMMAGGQPDHALIAANLTSALAGACAAAFAGFTAATCAYRSNPPDSTPTRTSP